MGHHSYVASEMNHLLKSTAIFACLTPEDIDFVMSLSDRLTLQDGQEIFRDGDNPTRFFVVIEGEVVIRTGEDVGHKTDIARFLPGDCFGELDFFTAERRTATALAVNPTQLLGFPPDNSSLSDISEKWPMVSARLFHGFLIHISSRIRKANAFVKSNSVLVRELKRQAYVDKLTGLFNKLYFEETLGNTLKSGSHGGLLMYKPDNFKQINDEYGHEAGDNILQFVAKALRQVVPDENLLFRYTGNENAVILPGATRESLWECGKKNWGVPAQP